MTGFSVDPGRIMGFAMLVDRGFGDLKAIEGYVDAIDTSGPYIGILEPLQPRVEAAIDHLARDIATAAGLMYGSMLAIDEAGRWYQTTDTEIAAALDAQLADVVGGACPAPIPNGRMLYSDVDEPTRHLVEPPSYNDMAWEASIQDIGSVVATVRDGIQRLTGIDILVPLTELSGDWRAIRRTAHRLVYVSRACSSVATNIRQGHSESYSDWVGDAGDAARQYLGDLSDGLGGLAAKATYLSDRLVELADGAFGFFEGISGVYSDIVDAGTVALLGAASTNPAGWGAALFASGRLMERINNLFDKYKDFIAFINAIEASLDLVRGGRLTVPDRDIAPLPPEPYDFPMPYR